MSKLGMEMKFNGRDLRADGEEGERIITFYFADDPEKTIDTTAMIGTEETMKRLKRNLGVSTPTHEDQLRLERFVRGAFRSYKLLAP